MGQQVRSLLEIYYLNFLMQHILTVSNKLPKKYLETKGVNLHLIGVFFNLNDTLEIQ
jgi:hypothetical protein